MKFKWISYSFEMRQRHYILLKGTAKDLNMAKINFHTEDVQKTDILLNAKSILV